VAGIGIPAALGLAYLGGWFLAGTLSALGVVGTRELFRMANAQGLAPLGSAGYPGAALAPIAVFAALPAGFGFDPRWLMLGGAVWIIMVMLAALSALGPHQRPLAAVGVTVFGVLYASGLPSFLLWLRHAEVVESDWAGLWLVALPLAVTWVCDTLAMLGGAAMGGPRLAPVLSPKKTWAGAVSGLVGAVLAAWLFGRFALAPAGVEVSTGALLGTGLAIGTLGQAGDLGESLFKREAGFKDSGGFFPGHGGVLDRLDSLYWGIPLTVIVLRVCGTI